MTPPSPLPYSVHHLTNDLSLDEAMDIYKKLALFPRLVEALEGAQKHIVPTLKLDAEITALLKEARGVEEDHQNWLSYRYE